MNTESNEYSRDNLIETEFKESDIQSLLEHVASLEDRCNDLQDKHKRALADYQNLLRRTQAERESMAIRGAELAVMSMIPALENFHYALKQLSTDTASVELYRTLEMLWNNLLDCMKSFGCEPIRPDIGTPFDAQRHNPISKVPSGDVEPDTVLELLCPGFVLNSKTLKPAQVILASAQQEG